MLKANHNNLAIAQKEKEDVKDLSYKSVESKSQPEGTAESKCSRCQRPKLQKCWKQITTPLVCHW